MSNIFNVVVAFALAKIDQLAVLYLLISAATSAKNRSHFLSKLPVSAITDSIMNYVSRGIVLVVLLLSSILIVRGKFDPYADNGGTTVGSLI